MLKLKRAALVFCACTAFAAFTITGCKSTPTEDSVAEAEETIKEEAEEIIEEADFSAANSALLEKINVLRQEAISSGAEEANPLAFKACELEYQAQKSAVESGTKADLSLAFSDLEKRYMALKSLAGAKAKKELIDNENLSSYDQTSYNSGKDLLDELTGPSYVIKSGADFYEKASLSESKFEAVLDASYRALAKAERTEAFKAKKDADSVKASVSRKADYDKAVEFFQKGDQLYVTKNPYDAITSYRQSKGIFTGLYAEISQARAEVQAKIDAAKARVQEVQNVAEDADNKAPLAEETEGIEDENAKLLEDDDFSKAEASVVEVSESIDEGDEEK